MSLEKTEKAQSLNARMLQAEREYFNLETQLDILDAKEISEKTMTEYCIVMGRMKELATNIKIIKNKLESINE